MHFHVPYLGTVLENMWAHITGADPVNQAKVGAKKRRAPAPFTNHAARYRKIRREKLARA